MAVEHYLMSRALGSIPVPKEEKKRGWRGGPGDNFHAAPHLRGKHEDKGMNPQHPGECGGSPAISGLERQKQRISPLEQASYQD